MESASFNQKLNGRLISLIPVRPSRGNCSSSTRAGDTIGIFYRTIRSFFSLPPPPSLGIPSRVNVVKPPRTGWRRKSEAGQKIAGSGEEGRTAELCNCILMRHERPSGLLIGSFLRRPRGCQGYRRRERGGGSEAERVGTSFAWHGKPRRRRIYYHTAEVLKREPSPDTMVTEGWQIGGISAAEDNLFVNWIWADNSWINQRDKLNPPFPSPVLLREPILSYGNRETHESQMRLLISCIVPDHHPWITRFPSPPSTCWLQLSYHVVEEGKSGRFTEIVYFYNYGYVGDNHKLE